MPEGVECLIIAESVQEWFSEQDKENTGHVKISLLPNYDLMIFKHSPIPISQFNQLYKAIVYSKICTFGKTLFFPSITGHCLTVQLGMSGTFSDESDEFIRAQFVSDDISYLGIQPILNYNDTRKFGNMMLFAKDKMPRNVSNLIKNSIDWRNKNAPKLFAKRIRKRKDWRQTEIKPILLNQQVLAGIGNIYASEALFASKIHPKTLVNDLGDDELRDVIKSAQHIMDQSYKVGGMTVRTFSSFGKQGFGRKYLKVYDKNATLCKTCQGAMIQKIKQNKRSTFYCPKCQFERITQCPSLMEKR